MKRLALVTMSTVGVALLSTHANSASFDCNKASTWVEKTICQSAELSKLDEMMAKKYRKDLTNAANEEDSEIYKNNAIIDQKLWLNFQRNTCKDKACLMREYKERIEDKVYYGMAWRSLNKLTASELPSKNAFGDFSQTLKISIYDSETGRNDIQEGENSISIRKVANKLYLSIIEGGLIFTNAHTCEIETSKATWSQNHWVINESQQDKTLELRLYPASYQGKNQLLLRDIDNKYRELHCGMRGYFDGIVLERE